MLDPLDEPISLIPGYVRDMQTTLIFQEKVFNASEVGLPTRGLTAGNVRRHGRPGDDAVPRDGQGAPPQEHQA
jgi:hypothetical protein